MKKTFIILLITLLVLCGCSKSSSEIQDESSREKEVELPTEICVDNTILSYYDYADEFEEKGFEPVPKSVKFYEMSELGLNKKNYVRINEKNEVRVINIVDSKITTYRGIRVGSSLSDVKNTFKCPEEQMNVLAVRFINEEEVRIDIDAKTLTSEILLADGSPLTAELKKNKNNMIYIQYTANEDTGIIESILICDKNAASGSY